MKPSLLLVPCAFVMASGAHAAPPSAPAAGTIRIDPPAGIDVTIPPLPAEPAFREPKAGWWKAASPCPRGSKPVRNKNAVMPDRERLGDDWHTSVDCARGGEPEGPFVMLRKNGSRFREGWAAGGRRHGLEREWFANGKLKHVRHYRAGEPVGSVKKWFENGDVEADGQYLDGKPHGLWVEGSDWGFVARGHYVRGVEEGRWVGELKTTTVVSIGYAKGQLHGEARVWRVTGQPVAVGTFVDGTGTWTAYLSTGERASVMSCKGGRLVDGTTYKKDGTVAGTLKQIDESLTKRDESEASAARWARAQLDAVCRASPIVLFRSRAFAPDHGSP